MTEYEALYILDTKGKDDKIDELIKPIEQEIQAAGCKLQGTSRLDRRKFERPPKHIDSGYYITVRFSADSGAAIDKIRGKLRFNETVFRQMYVRKDSLPGNTVRSQKAKAAALAAVNNN